MKRRTSLIARMTASSAVLAVVAIALTILLFALANSTFLSHVVQRTLWGYGQSLAEQVLASPDPEDWRRIAREHQVGLWVTTPAAERAFDAAGEEIPVDVIPSPGPGEVRTRSHGDDGEMVVFTWNLVHFTTGHGPILGIHLVMLTALIAVTYAFQHRQLRPLKWLRTGVDAVARGDFTTRVPVVRPDEIGQVADAFNRMTRQVEEMVADRERLLADVSHELRSPLTRVKVALELLPEGEKRGSIQRDVREMESLISVLLERERLRARTQRLETRPVDLAAVVRQVVETFADRSPRIVFTAPDEPLVVEADGDLVRLLMQNLVDNAVKFSRGDSSGVEVRLGPCGEGVELLVLDDGPGIPEADVERIFKPFVKLDPSRGHRTGWGLGLNLCWRIVEAHGGTIDVLPNGERGISRSSPSGGTQVRVTLPKTGSSQEG